MSTINKIKEKFKEFGPTSWSITNKTSIYLLMLFISLGGIYQFLTLPKEQFPEVVIPTMFVQTVYVGNSPKDIENLVTRPIEKQIKSISGVKIKDYTKKNAISIPINIVQNDDKGKFVYVAATENGKLVARKRPVTIGEFYANSIEILSGINAGEQVVTEGYQSLFDGQLLTASTNK